MGKLITVAIALVVGTMLMAGAGIKWKSVQPRWHVTSAAREADKEKDGVLKVLELNKDLLSYEEARGKLA